MSPTRILSSFHNLAKFYIPLLGMLVSVGPIGTAHAFTLPKANPIVLSSGVMTPCSSSSLHLSMSPCDNNVTGRPGKTDTLDVTITNSGSSNRSVTTNASSCTGAVSGCLTTPTSLTIVANGDNDFLVIWNSSLSGGTGTITVNIGGGGMTTTIHVTVPTAFTIDTTTTNLTDQMLSLCANGCFAGATSYSTTPYYTLDTPRNLILAYTEERAHPRPVIYADITPTPSAPTATQYTLEATLNGTTITFLNGDTKLYFSAPSGTLRLAGQFDASSYSTGIYSLVVTVTGTYPGSATAAISYSRPLAIVNESMSPIARGWTVVGVQHLYISGSSYLVTDGTGSAVYFASLGIQGTDYSTLTYNATGSYYVRSYPDSSQIYFTAGGLDTCLVDRLGFRTRYGYSGTKLTSISDPERYIRGNLGTYLSLSYGTYGIASISETGGTAGRTTSFTVASDSTLRLIKDPDGDSTIVAYDASKRFSKFVDRRGDTTTYNYDANSWKLTELDLPRIPADAGGGTTINVVPKIKYSPWQTLGVPTTATSSSSKATPIAKSAVQATITDPIGRVTTFTVNRWGQPLVITDPASRVTTITRSGILPSKVVYPDSGIDTVAYVTGTPFVSYSKTAGDSAVNYHYGTANQVDSIWGPGIRAEHRFLAATTGRIDSVRYGGTNTAKARYTYDGNNRILNATDLGGHTISLAYDATFGNVDSIARAGFLYSVLRLDAFGRDTADRVAGALFWRRTAYDTLNRVRKVWNIGRTGDTISVMYDALYPIRVQAPGGQIYKFSTNALGWMTTRYDSYDTTKYFSYRYDTAGRLTSFTNRRGGGQIAMQYDVLNRLLTRTVNSALADTFSYSTDGRRMRAIRKNVSQDSIYTYLDGTDSSIVRYIAGYRYAITYTYNNAYAGLQRSVTITNTAGVNFSQETDAIHDTVPSLDSLTLTGGHGAGTSVDSLNLDGLVINQRLPIPGSGITSAYTTQHQLYNSNIASYTSQTIADSLAQGIAFDSLGRVISTIRNIGGASTHTPNQQIIYDSVGQVLQLRNKVSSSCAGFVDTVAFGLWGTSCLPISDVAEDSAGPYTAAGNRTFPGATYSTTGNRLTAGPSGYSYTYDADGNMVTRTHGGVTDSLFWSANGLLDSVASGGGTGLRHMYEYNSFGQLVRRQTKVGSGAYSVDRYFLWDGNQLIAELPYPGTSRIAQYIYRGTDQPFAIATDSGGTSLVRYYYQDPTEGNLTGILRDTATLRQYTQYDAWGQQLARPINQLADTNRLGWKGLMYEKDSTRLYYVRNRWYDPTVGRFISEDPIGIAGGVNLYAFAGNDPINGEDPFGLSGGGGFGGGFIPTQGCGLLGDIAGDVASFFFGGNHSCHKHPRPNPQKLPKSVNSTGGKNFEGAEGSRADQVFMSIGRKLEPFNNAMTKGVSGAVVMTLITPVGGEAGALEEGVVEATEETSTSFFEGSQYSTKVAQQMQGGAGEFHSFPELVQNFESSGVVSDLIGNDGVVRQMLKIPGAYNGLEGDFEFIKGLDGVISHRFFNPY